MSQVTQVYGGDEVNAVVLDPGSAWTRVGWSSEDGPSISFSSSYAEREGQRRFGDEHTYLVREGSEINNPFEDSVVKDWDAAKELWKSALGQMSAERTVDYIREGPLLLSEPYWNTEAAQVKTMEFALEELEAPATYIAKSAVLSLFASGRGSGIVVDVGAQTLSVTPVVDGLILEKPARRSRRAGNYLSSQIRKNAFKDDDVVCGYQIKTKQPVPPGSPASFVLNHELPEVTASFHEFQVGRVMEQFKESMVQTSSTPWSSSAAAKAAPKRQFELPNGQRVEYGDQRFELGELLFAGETGDAPEIRAATSGATRENEGKNKASKDGEESNPSEEKMDLDGEAEPAVSGSSDEWSTQGISTLIIESLLACDVDIRANLANNIVVTGGSTLLQGLTERINQDLQARFPMFKIRIFASGNMVERRNGAWIGGSILASLGTFHQMWVTRQEYEESGAAQLAQKRFR